MCPLCQVPSLHLTWSNQFKLWSINQAPKPEPPAEKAPKKSAAKASEKKGKEVEAHINEEPLDPVAEKFRQQRLGILHTFI